MTDPEANLAYLYYQNYVELRLSLIKEKTKVNPQRYVKTQMYQRIDCFRLLRKIRLQPSQ